jgi:hypothetical protein
MMNLKELQCSGHDITEVLFAFLLGETEENPKKKTLGNPGTFITERATGTASCPLLSEW